MHKMVLGLLTVILVWVLVMTMSPWVFWDFFYRLESPVSIVAIRGSDVTMRFVRFARLPMTATYTNELQCDIMYQFGKTVGVLEVGQNTFVSALPLPEGAQGECQYRGSITYSPFGMFGPPFTTYWESEKFFPTTK